MTSPAGSSGDLIISFLVHDDHSDGAFSNTDGNLTQTEIESTTDSNRDDSRFACFWAIEDQAGGRSFTWSFTTGEEWLAVILRFSGHHATTPIGNSVIHPGTAISSLDVAAPGAMGVGFSGADGIQTGRVTAGSGWTNRVDHNVTTADIQIFTRPYTEDHYPYPFTETQAALYFLTDADTTSSATRILQFVIEPIISNLTLSGVTKDKDGAALGSCDVFLLKEMSGGNDFKQVGNTTSNVSTGAYSFTVPNDSDARFLVIARKADSPHVFDVTDWVLAPA